MSTEINPRVYGTEFEYGMLFNGSPEVPSEFFTNLPYGLGGIRQYRKNGSRIYPDVGHAEYATPECGRLDDIVAAELAGEEIFSTTLKILANGSPRATYRLHKRGIDHLGTAYGAHESYCVDRSIEFGGVPRARREYLIQALAIHYVSRMALVGAGYYDIGKQQWQVSQRAERLKVLSYFSCHSASTRPLVDIRDEALADESRYRRLHVSHGDPNVSPWALRTKIGMTSSFIRLLEANIPMDHLFLRNPLRAAHEVGSDTTQTAKLELHDGRRMTALELTETIAEKVLEMAEAGHIPADERIVAEDTYNTSGAATKDLNALMYRADWYTRRELVEQKAINSKYGGSILQRLSALDQMYDAIVVKQEGAEPVAGIGKRLRDEGRFGSVDQTQVRHLLSNPPPYFIASPPAWKTYRGRSESRYSLALRQIHCRLVQGSIPITV